MVDGATCLIAGASGTASDGGVRFPGEFFITANAFALGHVLNFWTLAYIANYYGELCQLDGATPVSGELPAPAPLPGLLRADLEVLAQ